MRTVLYNKKTKSVVNHKQEGIYDGPLLKDWVELTCVPMELVLATNEDVQNEVWTVDLENKTYVQSWEKKTLSESEVKIKEWEYPEFALLLEIDGSVLFTQLGAAYRNYLMDKGYPVEIQEDDSYKVWVDTVNVSHRPFVNQLKEDGLLTETERPV